MRNILPTMHCSLGTSQRKMITEAIPNPPPSNPPTFKPPPKPILSGPVCFRDWRKKGNKLPLL